VNERGVLYDGKGAVARIALDRPEASNAVDLPAAKAFLTAVNRAADDDQITAVLVFGNGKRFCAGGDVASMAKADDRARYLHELATTFDEGLRRLAELKKPVIAAAHGAAAGAGLALVLSSDVAVAARSTKFLMAYAGVGLTPDCGVSYLLPRAIGQQRALQIALTGRVLTAEEAKDWGLVAEVVDDDAVLNRANELATQLAEGPTFAFAETKRLIRSSWGVSREQSSKDEAETISRAVRTDDASALIAAFVGR
jgi:2-(1,2-epoxy-1,2-dihydrophenyl)acetyl-CoA isomerase